MAEASTRNLAGLPDVPALRRLLQSLAMLDVIVCTDWETRYFWFDASWREMQMLGSIKNRAGDEAFAVFNQASCFLKGFVHDSPMSPHHAHPPAVAPGVLDAVPAEFAELLDEPSLDIAKTTFCLWRRNGDEQWQHGEIRFPRGGSDPDGSEKLLKMLDGDPASYLAWAKEYYKDDCYEGRQLEVNDIARIYDHEPLSKELVAKINPDRQFRRLMADAKEIGYPLKKPVRLQHP